MGMIKGIPIILYEKNKVGEDNFGYPIYQEVPITVNNVLVSPASVSEILETQNLIGKKAVYNIAIPKGDMHEWEDCKVEFFGKTWRVIGFPQEGIEKNLPLAWNQKWMVERYE